MSTIDLPKKVQDTVEKNNKIDRIRKILTYAKLPDYREFTYT